MSNATHDTAMEAFGEFEREKSRCEYWWTREIQQRVDE